MSKINPSLASLIVPIDTLHEDPDNARAHDERNLSAIKMSLAHFGQQKPIVIDAAGCVIAGNGTLRSALDLGWKEIAAARFDSMDENAKRAFAIADNKTAELATWNFAVLAESLASLQSDSDNLLATGFKDFEIEPLLKAQWTPPTREKPPEEGQTTEEHKVTFKPEQWDVWLRLREDLTDAAVIDPGDDDATALVKALDHARALRALP